MALAWPYDAVTVAPIRPSYLKTRAMYELGDCVAAFRVIAKPRSATQHESKIRSDEQKDVATGTPASLVGR